MKPRSRFRLRPAVEHLESVNLMSAIPGVGAQPAVLENVVRLRGTVEGPITPENSGYRFGVLEGTLAIDGVDLKAKVMGVYTSKPLGGAFEIKTDRGVLFAQVTSQSAYRIYAGTDRYANATGEGTFHLNDPSAGKLRFVLSAPGSQKPPTR
jgi:hypothetical protein